MKLRSLPITLALGALFCAGLSMHTASAEDPKPCLRPDAEGLHSRTRSALLVTTRCNAMFAYPGVREAALSDPRRCAQRSGPAEHLHDPVHVPARRNAPRVRAHALGLEHAHMSLEIRLEARVGDDLGAGHHLPTVDLHAP